MPISSDGNRLVIHGTFSFEDCNRLLAAMHSMVDTKGYSDLTLDFSQCLKAYSPQMMAVCARCINYWRRSIDIEVVMPQDITLRRLFLNTNWAHLMDFRQFEPTRYRGFTHAPAIRFTDQSEQTKAVDRILDILLAAISHFRRDEIRYIEWAINEMTDNVLTHAQSPGGGIIQTTNFRQRERIEVVVADGGIGIPGSLRAAYPRLTDSELLHEAIREGVTRDKSIGQGNGLYGTWSICQKTEGEFSINSGYASLSSARKGDIRSSSSSIPMMGTLVTARIGYSDKLDLSEVLVFSGKQHIPSDYIETHYEADADGNVIFLLKSESEGFGSRPAGEPVRRKLINVASAVGDGKVIIDVSDIVLVSSSYADEVFGKLFVELGPLEFMKRIKIRNVDPLVKNLIDRAIMQRVQV